MRDHYAAVAHGSAVGDSTRSSIHQYYRSVHSIACLFPLSHSDTASSSVTVLHGGQVHAAPMLSHLP